MLNLKQMKGTFKGLVGECMFKEARKYSFLTRFHPSTTVFRLCRKYLSQEHIRLLTENWYSLDAIEIVDAVPTLFEIKTKNRYTHDLKYKPKTSAHTIALYAKAFQLGFNVQSATVWFEDNWNYTVDIIPFSAENYCIDKPKKWDYGKSSERT